MVVGTYHLAHFVYKATVPMAFVASKIDARPTRKSRSTSAIGVSAVTYIVRTSKMAAVSKQGVSLMGRGFYWA
jgi:hypothetical protein